ncbi:uncharacterized protein BO95DRAFT_37049 [Aspergillus brunneoviolaceus CBS 621.78]|uniref:Uncharacterized protein n=1 Tax=Aspergillus brunneoviolaceus CBS 621.78 TaxID=1450534 RepID=A0ACD1GI34_9EURO|nr:hypothetical protein BO95DRAFT_37049 [Aspergillus brunneoviolaceus CBS 621.78]RAH48820.1 hypothetical protein BO95DRAFT_37049 [Aspergillus brunneoviolaceus CBS 621.78]
MINSRRPDQFRILGLIFGIAFVGIATGTISCRHYRQLFPRLLQLYPAVFRSGRRFVSRQSIPAAQDFIVVTGAFIAVILI